MATIADSNTELDAVCNQLLQEVNFECSLCEAVYQDIATLNDKVGHLYTSIVQKSRAAKDLDQRKLIWLGGFFIASEIRQAGCMKKNLHQICAVDLSVIDETYSLIKERLEFLFGYPITDCNAD